MTPLCLLLTAALVFVSCLSEDENEVVLYNDCAITSFEVTTAPVYRHTTTANGEDSMYVTHGNNMTEYKFTIDQVNGLIYNVDSLPLGTDPTRLICNYTVKNNALVCIENTNRDAMQMFSTADSTDFSQARYLRVYSSDVTAERSYKVEVRVHKQDGNQFVWNRMADNADIAALAAVKTFVLNGRQVVLGSNGTATVMYGTSLSDGNTWTQIGTTFGAEAYLNAVQKNDSLIVLDGTAVRVTVDGETFTEHAQTADVVRLVGGCATELYGISAEGAMLVSGDAGKTWNADNLDSDQSLLPVSDMAYNCSAFRYMNGAEYVVLVGNRDISIYPNDGGAVVWRKIVEPGRQGKWAYMGGAEAASNALPRLGNLALFHYDGSIFALGGASMAGGNATPWSTMYCSRDGGITWKKSTEYTFPKEFDASASSCAVVVDGENNIRLVAGGTGQIWSGRLNRLGWNK